MEREKFLQCRNEIMDVLEKHGAEGWTQTRILASALSENLNPNFIRNFFSHLSGSCDAPDGPGAIDAGG